MLLRFILNPLRLIALSLLSWVEEHQPEDPDHHVLTLVDAKISEMREGIVKKRLHCDPYLIGCRCPLRVEETADLQGIRITVTFTQMRWIVSFEGDIALITKAQLFIQRRFFKNTRVVVRPTENST